MPVPFTKAQVTLSAWATDNVSAFIQLGVVLFPPDIRTYPEVPDVVGAYKVRSLPPEPYTWWADPLIVYVYRCSILSSTTVQYSEVLIFAPVPSLIQINKSPVETSYPAILEALLTVCPFIL